MHFSTFAIAAIAALPSIASAFTLADLSTDLGDASSKCASQYSIPLMSCPRLPGTCAPACQQQLESLQKTLQGACQGTKNPGGGLLAAALKNKLVDELCSGGASQPAVTSAPSNPSASPSFMVAPGKSFSGSVIQVSSVSAAAAVSSATGLVIDTSVPMSTGQSAAGAFPAPTYAPTTLATTGSAKPASTSASSGNSNANGSPFSSQPDAPTNGGAAVRAGVFSVVVGVIAVIANIA
ncbi:hypothetical protein Dda_3348 [Drechslerella dactyloides]|uniref:Extracellular membrane protein CFEM domain-containing protein n=1 Tax=Drechslerella dactyloides TaxID=74499 RepID=A0AAD6NLG8_DREDA|nr:hypothetical protein Dda_3348 [Drechslerella dactyloides]